MRSIGSLMFKQKQYPELLVYMKYIRFIMNDKNMLKKSVMYHKGAKFRGEGLKKSKEFMMSAEKGSYFTHGTFYYVLRKDYEDPTIFLWKECNDKLCTLRARKCTTSIHPSIIHKP